MGVVDNSKQIYEIENVSITDSQKNYLESGLLALIFYPIDSNSKSSVWGYTSNYYVKNVIDSFVVEEAGEEFRDNILKITLTLKHSETNQTKTFTRFIECKN